MLSCLCLTAVIAALVITKIVISSPPGPYVKHANAPPTAVEAHSQERLSYDEIGGQRAARDISDSRGSAEKLNSRDVGIVIVPGIQGTLLYRCTDAKKTSRCSPIFLSPMRSDTIDEIYNHISDIKTGRTIALTHKLDSVDYPAVTCAPKPYSHIGHCNRIPAYGPIRALRRSISTTFPSAKIEGMPYDWRLSISELTSRQSGLSIMTTFARVIDSIGKSKKIIVIAHGHGCRVMAQVLNQTSTELVRQKERIHALVCAAPTHPNQADKAMIEGGGVLLTGDAHSDGDACTNVREKRSDFSFVHSLLGMTRRRIQNVPITKGPWDAPQSWTLVSSNAQRARLANALPSIRELATTNGIFFGMHDVRNVFCIDARATENYTPACYKLMRADERVSVHKMDVDNMDISTLVGDILGRLIKE